MCESNRKMDLYFKMHKTYLYYYVRFLLINFNASTVLGPNP